MSNNPLNDISRVYLEQIAEKKEEVEIDEASYSAKAARAGKDIGKPGKQFAKIAKSAGERYGSKERGEKVAGAVLAKLRKEALDPVGREDKDIDNDGDSDKSDKYLLNRRKVRGAAISKKKMKESFSNWRQDLSEVMDDVEAQKEVKEKKVNNKITINPDFKESVENMGGTILEMVEVDEVDYIVESVYDELIEEGYDEDDIEEALEFALTEAKVTYGHDTSSREKKRGNLVKAVGRLARQKLASKVRGAKSAVSSAVSKGARKVAKGALGVARKIEGGDKTSSAAHTKTRTGSTYRGAGVGTKEKVSSGSYSAPTKKKAEKPSDPWKGSATVPQKPKPKPKTEKPSDPWEGSATTPPKAKAKPKATTKTTKVVSKKKKSNLDNLLASIRSEEFEIEEGMTMKDFKANRKKAKASATRADAVKRGHVGKEWYNSGRRYSPDEAKRSRANMDDEERRTRHRSAVDPDNENDDAFSADKTKNPKKLRKQKAMGEAVLDEKALSQQQQKFMGMVYAVKKGEMAAPSAAVAKAAAGMSKKSARDFAKTKHEGLPKKVEEQVDDHIEPTGDKKMEQQRQKIQMQKVRDLTTRLQAARKGVY